MCAAGSGQPSPCTDPIKQQSPHTGLASPTPHRCCSLKSEVLFRKAPQVQIRLKATLPLTPARDEPRKKTRKPIPSLSRKRDKDISKDKNIQNIKSHCTLQKTNFVYVVMAVQGHRIQSTSYRKKRRKKDSSKSSNILLAELKLARGKVLQETKYTGSLPRNL